MNMVNIIEKKKLAQALDAEEIEWFVRGAADGSIPDYQLAALLMAIRLNGMNREETVQLTLSMAHSGDICDLSSIPGIPVDKHSTGGVGDTTTLILAPLVAACGVPVAKMSGRGLGHTGGTLDKLESIPGLRVDLSEEAFLRQVRDIGVAVIGQTKNLAPADKTLYALRDVTATVDSIPLIASSIMSKKLAAGSDGIVLDVKTGSGAFMKRLEDSVLLAKTMVAIGAGAGRKVSALITDMDVPLGHAVGNALEVAEAVEILKGRGPEDLKEVCLSLAAAMLETAGKGSFGECRQLAETAVRDGSALSCLERMVEAQGGDARFIREPERFAAAPFMREVRAEESGFITSMDTERCGIASVLLKAGRSKKDDAIDYAAGIVILKKYGDFVEKGDVLARLYASDEGLFADAAGELLQSYEIGEKKPEPKKLVYARVSTAGVEYF